MDNESKFVKFSVSTPEDTKRRADEFAKQNQLSLSALVRLALNYAIENPGILLREAPADTQAYAA